MKINGDVVMSINNAGLDSLLSILGYPVKEMMDSEDWRDFDMDANTFVAEEAAYDLERKLNGERVYATRCVFRHERPEGGDCYE